VSPAQEPWPLNLIINAPEWESPAGLGGSTSLLQPVHVVTSDDTLLPVLRKSLLVVRTRQCAAARVLSTPEELAAFFELRYRVWSELGYLAPHKVCAQTPWELDYTDRTSLPLGVFSKASGKLLGGARLVRAFGEDNLSQIRTIEAMLRQRDARVLLQNFRYPDSVSHPFDLLGELNRFQEYYCDLVRSGIRKAEVSRVVVDADYRRLGFGEVIVETLCSLARVHAIRVLFLACHSRHAGFYRRCGFRTIRGVTGERFLTYEVPCVAMEQELQGEEAWAHEFAASR